MMIIAASWIAMACVLLQFWFMSKGMEKPAFFSALTGCVFWSLFAIPTGAWALLSLQAAIVFLSVRGLIRLSKASGED